MSTPCIVILTTESAEDILAQGGTQYWRIGQWRADHNKYVVCVRNSHHEDNKGPEPHGTAFLIGKIRQFVPADGRSLIEIESWATLDIPDSWMGERYPIRYRTLEELGIDVDSLQFEPVTTEEASRDDMRDEYPDLHYNLRDGLSFDQAKAGLAAFLKVPVSQIRISVEA